MTKLMSRRIRTLTSALLLLGLVACGSPQSVEETGHSQAVDTWDDYIASLAQDDVGPYRELGTSYVRGHETEFGVTLSARFYPESRQMRFVVVSQDLEGESIRSGGIESITLSTNGHAPTLQAESYSLNLSATGGELSAGTALVSVDPYVTEDLSSFCGQLALKFTDSARMPVDINYCHPVALLD